MTPSLSTLIFDLGNVVVRWEPHAALPAELSERDVDDFFARTDFFTKNADHDAGKPFGDWISELESSDNPEDAKILKHYVENFPASLTGLVPGTHELLHDLKNAGIRLFGLTNWSAETFHHAEAAVPSFEFFDDILVSGAEGMAKPDPRIFELALSRWDLTPELTGFVDDSIANVEAAESVGLTAHHFTSAKDARSWARDMTRSANV